MASRCTGEGQAGGCGAGRPAVLLLLLVVVTAAVPIPALLSLPLLLLPPLPPSPPLLPEGSRLLTSPAEADRQWAPF